MSRHAGRAAGRWWGRHGDTVKRTSRPVRKGWAVLVGYAWFIAYVWVGVMIGVGAKNLSGVESPMVMITAVGGGCLVGWWQARHRMAKHLDPSTPPLPRFGWALLAWLGVVALVVWLGLR